MSQIFSRVLGILSWPKPARLLGSPYASTKQLSQSSTHSTMRLDEPRISMARWRQHCWRMRQNCWPCLQRSVSQQCSRTNFRPEVDGGVDRSSYHASGSTLGFIEMLKIWGRANSIKVQKVLWCCGELGLEYERIDAGNEFEVNKTTEYRALNPNGLVPTIEDGHVKLWESNVIVRYLAHKKGNGRLSPAYIGTRFDAERWMDWQATTFWPVLRPLFIELIRTPPAKRDAEIISKGKNLSLAAARILNDRLADRTFLAGDPFRWEIFLQLQPSIDGMRWTSSIPNCATCNGGTIG